MRYPIWKKDDFFQFIGHDRIDMDADVVKLPEDGELVLVWGYNFDSPDSIVGKVIEVRLEDGEITGEVAFINPVFDDETMKEMKLRLGGYFNAVVMTDNDKRVASCILREVRLMFEDQAPGANPGARVR